MFKPELFALEVSLPSPHRRAEREQEERSEKKMKRKKLLNLIALIIVVAYIGFVAWSIMEYNNFCESILQKHPEVQPWIDLVPYHNTLYGQTAIILGVAIALTIIVYILYKLPPRKRTLYPMTFILITGFVLNLTPHFIKPVKALDNPESIKTVNVLLFFDEECSSQEDRKCVYEKSSVTPSETLGFSPDGTLDIPSMKRSK